LVFARWSSSVEFDMKTWDRPEREGVKVSWSGKIISVRPRIRLTRSFDQRTHSLEFIEIYFKGDKENEDRDRILVHYNR
jgi:hypothetical protein